jgi:hypothetical protein
MPIQDDPQNVYTLAKERIDALGEEMGVFTYDSDHHTIANTNTFGPINPGGGGTVYSHTTWNPSNPLVRCSVCAAQVDPLDVVEHHDWHARQDTIAEIVMKMALTELEQLDDD